MFVRASKLFYNLCMSNELENLGFSLRIDSSKSVNYVNYQAESLLKEALGNKQNSFSLDDLGPAEETRRAGRLR